MVPTFNTGSCLDCFSVYWRPLATGTAAVPHLSLDSRQQTADTRHCSGVHCRVPTAQGPGMLPAQHPSSAQQPADPSSQQTRHQAAADTRQSESLTAQDPGSTRLDPSRHHISIAALASRAAMTSHWSRDYARWLGIRDSAGCLPTLAKFRQHCQFFTETFHVFSPSTEQMFVKFSLGSPRRN